MGFHLLFQLIITIDCSMYAAIAKRSPNFTPKKSVKMSPCEFIRDLYGNVFVRHKYKYWWIYIDRYNDLILEEMYKSPSAIDNEFNDNVQMKIKHTSAENSLRGIAQNELDEIGNDVDDENLLDDDYQTYKENMRLYPEDKEFYFEDATIENDQNEGNVLSMEDANMTSNIIIGNTFNTEMQCVDIGFDSVSIYDTIFYAERESSTHEKKWTIVHTIENIEKAPYRITIYMDGRFTLNVVGSGFKYFIMKIGEDDIPYFKKA